MTGLALLILLLVPVHAAAQPTNLRLSNDAPATGGYISGGLDQDIYGARVP